MIWEYFNLLQKYGQGKFLPRLWYILNLSEVKMFR